MKQNQKLAAREKKKLRAQQKREERKLVKQARRAYKALKHKAKKVYFTLNQKAKSSSSESSKPTHGFSLTPTPV
jgi:exoribonuclease II